MRYVNISMLFLVTTATCASGEPVPMIDLLRAADVREQQTPSGKVIGSSAPLPRVVTTTTRALEAEGRIGELAHELEHNEALRSDARLYEFGVAILTETQGRVEGMRWPLLIAPEQIDFVANHLCDDGLWRRFADSSVAAKAPPEHRARMAASIVDCLESADYGKAMTLLGSMTRLDRSSRETNADLRSLVERSPGRFDALWHRVSQVEPVPVASAGRKPLEVQLGSTERALRLAAAEALFATSPDLADDIPWLETLQGEAKTAALGGMMSAITTRRHSRSPLRESTEAVQLRYFTIVSQAAGNETLEVLWPCCLSMYVNGVVQDPQFTPVVRAAAARTMAAIHASFPETADKAARFLQKAQELDPQ